MLLADIHEHQRYSPKGQQVVDNEMPKDFCSFRTRQNMIFNHVPKFSHKVYKIKETYITLRYTSQVVFYLTEITLFFLRF